MKRFISVLLLHILLVATPAKADWRWAEPHFKLGKIAYFCDTHQCIHASRLQARLARSRRVDHYNHHKEHEWEHWTSLYIPSCTWYGESGPGPEYARSRYDLRNGGSHGPPIEDVAHGKFQFKPSTYRSNGKYLDWFPLDQEIAARVLYWAAGTRPWAAC